MASGLGLGLGARNWHWNCRRCDNCCRLDEPTLGLGRLPRLRLSSRVRLWLRPRLPVPLRLRTRLLVLRTRLLLRPARLWVRTRLFVWAGVLRLRSGWTSRFEGYRPGQSAPLVVTIDTVLPRPPQARQDRLRCAAE